MASLARPACENLVSAELRRRMPARGYAKRVAYELGVSINTVHAVASGKRAPSLMLAERLGFQLVLERVRNEELELLAKLEAELMRPELHKEGE